MDKVLNVLLVGRVNNITVLEQKERKLFVYLNFMSVVIILLVEFFYCSCVLQLTR